MESRGVFSKHFGVAVVTAEIGVGVPAAASGATLLPLSHNFGDQTVGTASAPQPFTLEEVCPSPDVTFPSMCLTVITVIPAVSTTGDFAQTNNCPSALTITTYPGSASCTINVTFNPTATGLRTGLLSAAGVTSNLSGNGLGAPVVTTQPGTFDLKAAIKRCKKKFPKGPKRKKCIKKAKARAGV
jgi:hypothetical protein